MKSDKAYSKLINMFKTLRRHDKYYHGDDQPIINDANYDQLRDQFTQLLTQYPQYHREFELQDTPGIKRSKGFTDFKHTIPMLSLEKIKTNAELQAFLKRTQNIIQQTENIEYWGDVKIDGLSISLRYENGKLVSAATRGNGRIGEDITANILALCAKNSCIPTQLLDVPKVLEVRGEVYISKSDFYELNIQQKKQGCKPFANPRNAAAGSIRQNNVKIVATRPLKIFCFGLGQCSAPIAQTMEAVYEKFYTWGLPTSNEGKLLYDIETMQDYWQCLSELRSTLEYDIDGVVFKLNSLNDHVNLGSLMRTPKWAVAAKFAPDSGVSQITDIVIHVGRTGIVTPIAQLKPINIGGTMIRRVNLHNQKKIIRLDIRIGDFARIIRAGDVIPEIESIIKYRRTRTSKEYVFPTHCPSCNRQLINRKNQTIIVCPGGNKCIIQQKERLQYFVSRQAMNIEGLGKEQINLFYDKGLIRHYADIYHLQDHRKTITGYIGFGEKMWIRLMSAIENSRQVTLQQFIVSLGIPQVGEITSLLLAKKFDNINTLLSFFTQRNILLIISELQTIKGVGITTAKAIVDYFRSITINKELEALIIELTIIPFTQITIKNTFSQKTLVFTGKLVDFSRTEAQNIARQHGAKISSTVSHKTDLVIAGTNAGSNKLTKAKKLKIKIWNENQWLKSISNK